MFDVIARKLRSAQFHMRTALRNWDAARDARTKQDLVDAWVSGLKASPPDVLIGANFATFGGVRQHIHAIQKYSGLKASLVPSDDLMRSIGASDFLSSFQDRFIGYSPVGVKAIHSHVYPWFINWCKRQNGLARWVHTYHLPYFAEHAKSDLLPWQHEINKSLLNEARHADLRISVSKWQCEYLLGEHGIDTVVVPNGVDVAMCDRGNAGRFKTLHGVSDFVLYVGRNDPVKDPAAFVQLAKRLPSVRFVMVGRGLSRAALIADFDVEPTSNLLILPELNHASVQDAIAAASAVVVTSKREGLPTLVLEALAQSKPVIVSNERGSVEATAEGQFGAIYELGNLDDLVAKTEYAINGPPVISGARNYVVKNFDWKVIARRLDAIYRGETESHWIAGADQQ